MKILLVITPYLPAQTPNTLRWLPIVTQLGRLGHEVSVLTTKRHGSIDESSVVTVYRAGYHTLQDRIYDLGRSQSRRHEVGSAVPKAGLRQTLLQGMVNKFWRSRYWPDGSKLFLEAGIDKGKTLLENNDFSHIISVGLPFTAHLVAQALKEYKPDLHWHMDIQDPFCYSKEFRVNNYAKYKDKNVAAEAKAFELANSISITNERAKEKYLEYFPQESHKLKVIPPLWHAEETEVPYEMILFSQKIHLGYFGSFYENVRSPRPFLEFLSFLHSQDAQLLDKVQFHFVGQMDRVSMALIEQFSEVRSYIVIHGFKTRAETISAMKQVDILLNFGNTTDYHLPSKVVDYLAMAKPVLNLATIPADSTAHFFSDKQLPFKSLLLTEPKLEDNRQAFYDFVFEQSAQQEIKDDITPYEVEAISKQYLSQLSD